MVANWAKLSLKSPDPRYSFPLCHSIVFIHWAKFVQSLRKLNKQHNIKFNLRLQHKWKIKVLTLAFKTLKAS